jgi:hypothetical protein
VDSQEYSWGGSRKRGVFAVRHDKPYNITKCDFPPNGDLLLLELTFSLAARVAMQMGFVPRDQIHKYAIA